MQKTAAYSYHFQCTGRKWSCLVNCFPVHKKRRKEWEHAQLIMQTCGTGNMRCCLVSALGRRFIWQVFEKLCLILEREGNQSISTRILLPRVCKIKVAITFPTEGMWSNVQTLLKKLKIKGKFSLKATFLHATKCLQAAVVTSNVFTLEVMNAMVIQAFLLISLNCSYSSYKWCWRLFNSF